VSVTDVAVLYPILAKDIFHMFIKQ